MNLKFFKYQGTGNDFIMIDNRKKFFDTANTDLVKFLCDRRFGVGADGFILLEEHPDYDFQMVYFNSDGNQSSMCGNGGRCIVQFASDMGVIGNETSFLAIDGEHDAYIKDGLVHLKMIDVEAVEAGDGFYFLNTGSPHYVQYVQKIKEFAVYDEGYKVRNNERFRKEGTNVNFIEKEGDRLWVRTYERGVEDETYSCGTGVTASALVASLQGMKSPIPVTTLGGDLSISFQKAEKGYKDIYLIGPAKQVFEGVIKI